MKSMLLAVSLSFLTALAMAGEKPVLHVFTWSSYFAPEVLAGFEDDFDCTVAIDTFDSNEEMRAQLEQGGYDYDIITPSAYVSEVMHAEGIIMVIDHSRIPNIIQVDKKLATNDQDPAMLYSVPYTRTITGVGYNVNAAGKFEKSWNIFANPALSKRMTMLDDIRETLGAALKYLGYSLNTTDENEIMAAARLLQEWKKTLSRIEVDQANIELGNGHLLAAHAYNGDIAVLMEADRGIDFFVPKEGSAITIDDFVILANTNVPDLAHAFINYMLEPDNAAKNMESILYYMPIPKAIEKLPEELRSNSIFEVAKDILAKCERIRDVGPALKLYEKAWEMVVGKETAGLH